VVNVEDRAKESLLKNVPLAKQYGSAVMDVWLRLITSLVPTAKKCYQCAFSGRVLQQDGNIVVVGVAGRIVGSNVDDNISITALSEAKSVVYVGGYLKNLFVGKCSRVVLIEVGDANEKVIDIYGMYYCCSTVLYGMFNKIFYQN
jgi:hypothetical protein